MSSPPPLNDMEKNTKFSELGKKSGEARRKVDLGLSRVELKSPKDALRLLEIIVGSTLSGRLDVKKGTGIASIIRVWGELRKEHLESETVAEIIKRLDEANI